MFQITEIEELAPGAAELSVEEWTAITRFTILWTLFEAQVLDNCASVKKIIDKVQTLPAEMVVGDWFREQLAYFADRYVESGSTNYIFTQLHMRNNDNPTLVKAVLRGENNKPSDQLIACLTIVYRFRNNFFHGLKWAYGLRSQLDNFTHASALLAEYMKRFQRCYI